MAASIAVINCKKTKKTYPCPVREMYEDSALFRAQLEVMRTVYGDRWQLVSTKYGVVSPEQKIRPYNVTIYFPAETVKAYLGKDAVFVSSSQERKAWAHKVAAAPIWTSPKHSVIDCWLSDLYWMNLFRQLKPSMPVRWVRPVTTGRGIGPAIKALNEIAAYVKKSRLGGSDLFDRLLQKKLIYIAKVIMP